MRRVLAGLALLFLLGGGAAAHPMGNFSVNRWTSLTARAGGLDVVHLVDFAEIPTQTELASAGLLGRSGPPTRVELAAMKEALLKRLLPGLRLEVGGVAVPLSVSLSTLDVAPGAADLPTLRLRIEAKADLAKPARETAVRFVDANFEGRAGWKEVIATAVPGATLVRSNVPARDVSAALRDYPTDPSVLPPETTSAELVVTFSAR